MAGEWADSTVGDVFDLVNGYAFKSADFIEQGIPVIKIKNVKAGEFSEHEFAYVSREFLGKRGEKLAQFGDLLISMSGNRHDGSPETWVGKVAQFRKTGNYFINQRVGALRVKKLATIDSRFASYVLSSRSYQELFIAIATSSGGQANLSPSQILGAHFRYPPLSEQRAIAHILGTLDDKIELNRRRNQTLEAMARALFKDWFVDFGPVRAKMEGQEPYLPADLWQLFPDRLDDEGMPEGWSERPLDEIADFLNGLALQKFPATDPDDSLPVIKIAELRNGVSAKSDRASREVPAKYIIKDGDFLFSWSGSLLAKFWTEGEGALNQHLFKVTSESYPIWFVSHWVHHHLEAFQAIAASKATTMGHIQRGHLKAAMTLCPPENVLERLGVVMAPLVEQSIHNELESRSLAQLRDTLLPKLISGELRIADAEQFIARSA
jgi:type I restriction enzyme, S subunit